MLNLPAEKKIPDLTFKQAKIEIKSNPYLNQNDRYKKLKR